MAEGFARAYGSDVVDAYSAGLAPANLVAEQTRKTMFEKNIDLAEQFPKDIRFVRPELMDMVINLSGLPLPPGNWKDVREWLVPDPIGKADRVYREVRGRIETLVMELLLELRSGDAGLTPERLRFGRPRTQP
jgi:protein-tyrosine-phosphatase